MFFDECYADCYRKAWRARRLAEIEISPFCGICGLPRQDCQIILGIDLDLHHMTYRNRGHELSWELIPLCRDCHDTIEKAKSSTYSDSFLEVQLHQQFKLTEYKKKMDTWKLAVYWTAKLGGFEIDLGSL